MLWKTIKISKDQSETEDVKPERWTEVNLRVFTLTPVFHGSLGHKNENPPPHQKVRKDSQGGKFNK